MILLINVELMTLNQRMGLLVPTMSVILMFNFFEFRNHNTRNILDGRDGYIKAMIFPCSKWCSSISLEIGLGVMRRQKTLSGFNLYWVMLSESKTST